MIRAMETWREFATYSDAASAEVILGLLRSENIPARVLSDEPMPGNGRARRQPAALIATHNFSGALAAGCRGSSSGCCMALA